DRLRDVRRAVRIFALEIVAAERIRKQRGIPVDLSDDRAGVRVEQQFRRIAAEPLRRIPRAVNAEPVSLSRTDTAQIPMEAERRTLRQRERAFVALLVEQTQVDPFSHFGEQGEVCARAVPAGAEWERLARLD